MVLKQNVSIRCSPYINKQSSLHFIILTPIFCKVEIEKLIKQTHFKDEFHKSVVNLIYTSNHFQNGYNELFQQYGIQSRHFNILRILKGKYPECLSPGEIIEVMLDKGGDLTRLIDKLVKKGWVTRCICPDNKRKMNINLTHHGIEIIEEINKIIDTLDTSQRLLTEDEYIQINTLLNKMRG